MQSENSKRLEDQEDRPGLPDQPAEPVNSTLNAEAARPQTPDAAHVEPGMTPEPASPFHRTAGVDPAGIVAARALNPSNPNLSISGAPTATRAGVERNGPVAAGPSTPWSDPASPIAIHPPQPQASTQPATETVDEEPEPAGLLDLMDAEEIVSEVDSGDDGRFVLTNRRIIFQGRSGEGALFTSAAIDDVTVIGFGRRARDSRSAWWGVIGVLAALSVWQVTTNETVGAIAGAIVGGISLLLLADYWFRPAGLVLSFGTAGGRVEGPVAGKRVREAEQLAARAQQIRHRPASGGAGVHPPGGSPGLR